VEGKKERKVTFLSGIFPSEYLPLLYLSLLLLSE
jgi:hypothetical protein